MLALKRVYNTNTNNSEVIVLLKSLEDLVRLCQKRYLNGHVLSFEIAKTSNNAIFYFEDQNKIQIKYDPNEINRSIIFFNFWNINIFFLLKYFEKFLLKFF